MDGDNTGVLVEVNVQPGDGSGPRFSDVIDPNAKGERIEDVLRYRFQNPSVMALRFTEGARDIRFIKAGASEPAEVTR